MMQVGGAPLRNPRADDIYAYLEQLGAVYPGQLFKFGGCLERLITVRPKEGLH